METCTRSQRFVRTWDASCDGTLASKHGTAPVTAHALMLWVASSTARPFAISSASKYLVRSSATLPAICPTGDPPNRWQAEPKEVSSYQRVKTAARVVHCDLGRGLSTDEPTSSSAFAYEIRENKQSSLRERFTVGWVYHRPNHFSLIEETS